MKRMKVLRSMDDVPEFENEDQEAEFWATHELGDEIIDQMGPPPDGLLPPPDSHPRPPL
jgi:hypothetical protein